MSHSKGKFEGIKIDIKELAQAFAHSNDEDQAAFFAEITLIFESWDGNGSNSDTQLSYIMTNLSRSNNVRALKWIENLGGFAGFELKNREKNKGFGS